MEAQDSLRGDDIVRSSKKLEKYDFPVYNYIPNIQSILLWYYQEPKETMDITYPQSTDGINYPSLLLDAKMWDQ